MKAVVVTDAETKLPIAFVEVRDYLDREEMLRMKQECEKNAKAKAEKELKEKKALNEKIEALGKKTDTLTKAMKLVLGFGGDLDEVEKELTGGESNG